MSNLFSESDMISAYSRAQAIEDGVLVDVTQSREYRESGFRFPIALTRAVYERYVAVPEGVRYQDEAGRLWGLLYMLRYGIAASNPDSTIKFKMYVRNDDNRKPRPVWLKGVCGPGDSMEPVITVMLPEED